jgi:hypothetical protein
MATFAPASHAEIAAAQPHKTKHRHPWLIALGLILLLMIVLVVVGNAQAPKAVHCTSPQCSITPIHATPLSPPTRYVSSQYGFSLDYSTANVTPSKTTANSIAWDATLSDNSEVLWTFVGTDPQGRSPQQIVNDVQQNNYADASYAYTIPGADLGYTPGYGNVYDVTVAPGGGAAVHDRLIVIAAVKNNVAVVFLGLGPYQATNPKIDGHPNPSDTPLVNLGDFEENLKSVTWKGDPPL